MLSVEYCREKLFDLDKTIRRYQKSEIQLHVEYKNHLQRLERAYQAELMKAMNRPKPITVEYEIPRAWSKCERRYI